MANIKIYTRNALSAAGVVLKNGTGGGAPALDQDSDWPMSHLLSADRYTYWRTSAAPADPINIDFDLGASQTIAAVAVTMLRLYGQTLDPGGLDLFYGTGSVYPPTWIDLGLGPAALLLNNNAAAIAGTAGRFWRYGVGGMPSVGSMKLWLVKAADVLDLGHDWSIGTEEGTRRLREEVSSPAGLTFSFEPGENRGSTIRSGSYLLRAQSEAARDALRDQLSVLDSRFLVSLGDGTVIETSLPKGELPWSRRWSYPQRFDFAIPLEEHP